MGKRAGRSASVQKVPDDLAKQLALAKTMHKPVATPARESAPTLTRSPKSKKAKRNEIQAPDCIDTKPTLRLGESSGRVVENSSSGVGWMEHHAYRVVVGIPGNMLHVCLKLWFHGVLHAKFCVFLLPFQRQPSLGENEEDDTAGNMQAGNGACSPTSLGISTCTCCPKQSVL